MENSQFMHYHDPDCTRFTAFVTETLTLPDGRRGVILDQTYFYATGGGQEHDTGTLDAARVVDVFKDEARGRVVHVIEGVSPSGVSPSGVSPSGDTLSGRITGQIDAERRLRHRQHHTAQHLLTQCCAELFGLETLSANINGHSPSTLDLPFTNLGKLDLDRAEDQANQIIYENRPVKTYFVAPGELSQLPATYRSKRKPSSVSENLRIVEIDGYDYSACGGTHVRHTGQIGVLKIVKAERQNDRLRIHFIAGWQALHHLRACFDALNGLAAQMSTGLLEAPTLALRQNEQLQAAQKELQALRLERLALEAQQFAARAERVAGWRQAAAHFENRSPAELRALADRLKGEADLVAILTAYDGQKLSAIVTCGLQTGLSAAEVLRRLLTPVGGRGGGSPQLAQGGGALTPAELAHFLATLPGALF
jgi:alanyl-tRNA synthetase